MDDIVHTVEETYDSVSSLLSVPGEADYPAGWTTNNVSIYTIEERKR